MEERANAEQQMIEELIRKRKQENDAFIKLLQAIESKGSTSDGIGKSNLKSEAKMNERPKNNNEQN